MSGARRSAVWITISVPKMAATMPPVGAPEVVVDVADDEPIVDEVAVDPAGAKPAVRRRPAARKPD